jgi:putative transposase
MQPDRNQESWGGSPGSAVSGAVGDKAGAMPTDMYRSRNRREAVTSRLRLRDYDYRQPGSYFITICTHDRLALFGHVAESVMTLNPAGTMLHEVWSRIPGRYPTVVLDHFVVMPNHIHGIICLEPDLSGNMDDRAPSLSDVVRWFKIQSTMKYGDGVKIGGWTQYRGRLWQPGFMDHIIRSENALGRLRGYIESNPALWEDDTFHPDAKRPGASG